MLEFLRTTKGRMAGERSLKGVAEPLRLFPGEVAGLMDSEG